MESVLRRYSLILLAVFASILGFLTLRHVFGPTEAMHGEHQSASGRNGWLVPITKTTTLVEKSDDASGVLSFTLVVVPFLQYNANEELIKAREEEYKTVLQRNLNHRHIKQVHVLTTNAEETKERFKDLGDQDKLLVVEVKSIDNARDPFEYISRNFVGEDVAFANADIYFGGGFEHVDPRVMADQKIMYALTRRVASGEKCTGPDFCTWKRGYIGSHDVFLFHLFEPFPEDFLRELEFDLVCPGQENIVIWLFQDMLNYCTLNPCRTLETFHYHCTHLRNKGGKPRVNHRGKSGHSPFTNNMNCSLYT